MNFSRIINNFKRDRLEGGNFWETFRRKFIHSTYMHAYEWWSIKSYLKGNVLNVGAGRDNQRRKWAEATITTFDQRPAADDYTKSHKWEYGAPDVVGNAHKLDFPDGTFDCVLAMHLLEHCERPEIVLKEFFRVTKYNGHVVLILPCGAGNKPYNYWKDGTHLFIWTRYDFLQWLVPFVKPEQRNFKQSTCGNVVQYCKMKKIFNSWSFDIVLRKC